MYVLALPAGPHGSVPLFTHWSPAAEDWVMVTCAFTAATAAAVSAVRMRGMVAAGMVHTVGCVTRLWFARVASSGARQTR
jgi:hypothetical protein